MSNTDTTQVGPVWWEQMQPYVFNVLTLMTETRSHWLRWGSIMCFPSLLPAIISQAVSDSARRKSTARSIMEISHIMCVYTDTSSAASDPIFIHVASLSDLHVYWTKWLDTTDSSIYCFRGWDNKVSSLASHDPLLLSIIQESFFKHSAKNAHDTQLTKLYSKKIY